MNRVCISIISIFCMIVLSPQVKAEEIVLNMNHGGNEQILKAFAAGPETADAAVLIVHDWFGISDLTRQTVERLGKKGLRAVAVDLYNGSIAKTHAEAKILSSALQPDYAQAAIVTALTALDAKQKSIVIVGYSMGGSIALRAAAENSDQIKATGLIYGGGYQDINDEMLGMTGPVLSITGSADEWSYPEQTELAKRMNQLNHPIEAYVYPGADHAFAQPLYNEGKAYDEIATRAMRNVLDEFLGRHLGIEFH